MVPMPVIPGLTRAQVEKRIDLLNKFKDALLLWGNRHSRGTEEQQLAAQVLGEKIPPDKIAIGAREFINMNLGAVRRAVSDVGHGAVVNVPNGGVVVPLDAFDNIFTFTDHRDLLFVVHDAVERAIGDYIHVRDETGLVTPEASDTFDLKGAIERSLRLAFPKAPPGDEKEVQRQVAVILAAQGMPFTKEQEGAPGAAKTYHPDFVVSKLDLAIEVKYSRPSRPLPQIEEEMAADITGFQRRWKRLLFIVYDDQQIVDINTFRRMHMNLTGVDVIVVKH
jgi:hypothetical protein